jgi:hypothetical protein
MTLLTQTNSTCQSILSVRQLRRWHQLTSCPNVNTWIPYKYSWYPQTVLFCSPQSYTTTEAHTTVKPMKCYHLHPTRSLRTWNFVEKTSIAEERQKSRIVPDYSHIRMGRSMEFADIPPSNAFIASVWISIPRMRNIELIDHRIELSSTN